MCQVPSDPPLKEYVRRFYYNLFTILQNIYDMSIRLSILSIWLKSVSIRWLVYLNLSTVIYITETDLIKNKLETKKNRMRFIFKHNILKLKFKAIHNYDNRSSDDIILK